VLRATDEPKDHEDVSWSHVVSAITHTVRPAKFAFNRQKLVRPNDRSQSFAVRLQPNSSEIDVKNCKLAQNKDSLAQEQPSRTCQVMTSVGTQTP
jgi:hypothetical protein